jgi:hypothetical protein
MWRDDCEGRLLGSMRCFPRGRGAGPAGLALHGAGGAAGSRRGRGLGCRRMSSGGGWRRLLGSPDSEPRGIPPPHAAQGSWARRGGLSNPRGPGPHRLAEGGHGSRPGEGPTARPGPPGRRFVAVVAGAQPPCRRRGRAGADNARTGGRAVRSKPHGARPHPARLCRWCVGEADGCDAAAHLGQAALLRGGSAARRARRACPTRTRAAGRGRCASSATCRWRGRCTAALGCTASRRRAARRPAS